MELAILVWIISALNPLISLLAVIATISAILGALFWVIYGTEQDFSSSPAKIFTAIFCASLLGLVVIPTEKTAYLMVGAYASQKIAEAPKTQQLGAEVLKILETKLKAYAIEAEEDLNKKLDDKK